MGMTRRVLGYLDARFKLAPAGSWKVGGDVDVLPEPRADGISGYNMGCRSLPNRVEHYHTPRMLIMCTTLMATAAARGAR